MKQTEETDSLSNQDGWLNALSLDQLTSTVSLDTGSFDLQSLFVLQGMRVVSGSLDVLESVGKKTFDVSVDVQQVSLGENLFSGDQ